MNTNRAWFAAAAVAALTAGSAPEATADEAAAGGADNRADFRGIVPPSFPLCAPFVDDNDETVEGFLVVRRVKDHPNPRNAGVEPGDVCLSWGTDGPKPPETLRDAWLDFLNWGRSDEDECWFARDRDGRIEVFSCGGGELYECMVALGTFCLELAPTAFPKEEAERIRAAARAAGRDPEEDRRSGADTLHPSLLRVPFEPVLAFETADGALAGRVDALPTKRLGDWADADPGSRGDFDDELALYRVALYEQPVSPGQEPEKVFYATRRVNGTSGNHTYVDATWRYSLDVDPIPGEGPWDGNPNRTKLVLTRWAVSCPELGAEAAEKRLPCHPVPWRTLLARKRIRPGGLSCSPFEDGLSALEETPSTGCDADADAGELLAFRIDPAAAGDPTAVRASLDEALLRFGAPTVRRVVSGSDGYRHVWAWTKGGKALVFEMPRTFSSKGRGKETRANVVAGAMADDEDGFWAATVGRTVDWKRADRIVYTYSDAPIPKRKNVRLKLSEAGADGVVTDGRGVVLRSFHEPLPDFPAVRDALRDARVRWFGRKKGEHPLVGGSAEFLTVSAGAETLAKGEAETGDEIWLGPHPYPKKVREVLLKALPFEIEELSSGIVLKNP